MDLGDWQELARLRAENHVWHRCVGEILDALAVQGATPEMIVASIERSVGSLNEHLVKLRRRPVTRQR